MCSSLAWKLQHDLDNRTGRCSLGCSANFVWRRSRQTRSKAGTTVSQTIADNFAPHFRVIFTHSLKDAAVRYEDTREQVPIGGTGPEVDCGMRISTTKPGHGAGRRPRWR